MISRMILKRKKILTYGAPVAILGKRYDRALPESRINFPRPIPGFVEAGR